MAFPDVPNVPGVPPLPRDPNAIIGTLALLAADVGLLFGDFLAPRWGLFQNGFPVVICESVVEIDYKQDWTVATYPLEQGAFESYDKVALPFDVRLRFSAGGSELDRLLLLESIAAISPTLDLFDAYTPEKIYPSVNVVHYDYRRTSINGVGMIVIDLWCVQVRVTAQAAFSSSTQAETGQPSTAFGAGNTKTPSGSDPVGIGNVQPSPAPLRIDVHPKF